MYILLIWNYLYVENTVYMILKCSASKNVSCEPYNLKIEFIP